MKRWSSGATTVRACHSEWCILQILYKEPSVGAGLRACPIWDTPFYPVLGRGQARRPAPTDTENRTSDLDGKSGVMWINGVSFDTGVYNWPCWDSAHPLSVAYRASSSVE